MKLLVLAQTPPPTHGQSLMVEALVSGLPRHGIEVRHIQMRLSDDHLDIGRVRPGKIWGTLRSACAARRAAKAEKFDALYYVPAPAKRPALYRDIAAMRVCRCRGLKVALHWHAHGLGSWVSGQALGPEQRFALRALGGADLSIVLSSELAEDAAVFAPLKTIIVANGIEDPGMPGPARPDSAPFNILFLGLGSREKGLFDALEAIALLAAKSPSYRLTVAGGFASRDEEALFRQRAAAIGPAVSHVGFADQALKKRLLAEADLFCFPTYYPHEGQPLALIEALASDLRIVTTRWRGIPGMLPEKCVWYSEPRDPRSLAAAIEAAAASPRPNGAMRRHYLDRFTLDRHLSSLAEGLKSLAH